MIVLSPEILNGYTMTNINEQGEWIDAKKEQPNQFGWYRIKTIHGEYEAPFVRNGHGVLQWVVPDESIITHWFKTDE